MNEPKVYISYSHGDIEWVRQFAEALRKRDIDVWLDDWKIKPGDLWQEKVEAGLRGSDAIVSVLTAENAQSPGLFADLGLALGMGKPLIPIVSADLDSAAIPSPIRSRRYVLRGAPDEAAREVAKTLKVKAA
jgi:hypothetical protein